MARREDITPSQEQVLLEILQRDFPLHPKPFLCLATILKIDEIEILNLLQRWQSEGKLRQISAIFDPKAFQHRSSLFAFKVGEEILDRAKDIVNAHPGVSHNYLRDHPYNLWFTLVVPPNKDLMEEVDLLFRESGASDYLYLPVVRVFKISTVFHEKGENTSFDDNPSGQEAELQEISEMDKALVRALQEPLPLVREPFKDIAKKLGLNEEEIFSWLKEKKAKGALRRFGALFKHQKLGFVQNIMVGWSVSEDRIEEVAQYLARKTFITHCYQRKTYSHWPYNLYTMCHFKERGKEAIEALAKEIKLTDYLALETLKEFKKTRLKLFYQ